MSYENDNEERRLFDQIVLQLVSCGSTEPPEVIATRVIDRRRAYFDANTLNAEIERQRGVIRSQNNEIARMQERIAVLESRPDAAEVLQRVRSKLNEAERLDASDNEGHVYVIRIGDALETIDAETDSLTGPKKPTKPGGES